MSVHNDLGKTAGARANASQASGLWRQGYDRHLMHAGGEQTRGRSPMMQSNSSAGLCHCLVFFLSLSNFPVSATGIPTGDEHNIECIANYRSSPARALKSSKPSDSIQPRPTENIDFQAPADRPTAHFHPSVRFLVLAIPSRQSPPIIQHLLQPVTSPYLASSNQRGQSLPGAPGPLHRPSLCAGGLPVPAPLCCASYALCSYAWSATCTCLAAAGSRSYVRSFSRRRLLPSPDTDAAAIVARNRHK